MNPQTLAKLTGLLFLITYITSIPALFVFYAPVLKDPTYITGAGPDTSVLVGAFLEVLLIIANVGTALTLFPVLKRQNEVLALGYVTARLVECGFIAVGILSLVTVVTLRQEAAGAAAASLILVGQALVAIKNWTFLLGPSFVVGVGNGLMLGYLMYRSGLVPRPLALLGLIGGPLLCASGIAVLFGVLEQGGAPQSIASMPEFLWELSLGIYLTVKGFKPTAAASQPGRTATSELAAVARARLRHPARRAVLERSVRRCAAAVRARCSPFTRDRRCRLASSWPRVAAPNCSTPRTNRPIRLR